MSDTAASRPSSIRAYWRPGCPFCMSLRLGLKRTSLPVEWRNIWKNDEDAAYVRSVNQGNETVPTVDIAGKALINPSTRQVLAEVRNRAPHLLATGRSTPNRFRLPWRRKGA